MYKFLTILYMSDLFHCRHIAHALYQYNEIPLLFLYHYILSMSPAHTLMFTRVKKLHVRRRSKDFDGMLIYLSTINVTQFVWFYHRNHFPSSRPTGPVKILSKQGIAAED